MAKNIFLRIFNFYSDGFKNMTYGKSLWIIILIKLFVMFAILKVFFFEDFLGGKFETKEEKEKYMIEQLTN